MAVDDSTKPMAARNATTGGNPTSTPTPVSSAPQVDDLRDAEPEDLAPQAPQPRRLHLEPDDEQEHHHAELGDMQDRLRAGEQLQPERADHQAGGQVAQHRAEPGALEQRNGDHRRAEQRDDMHQIGSLLRRRHLFSAPARSSDPRPLVYPKTPCTASLAGRSH